MLDRENGGETGNQFSPLLIRNVGTDITTRLGFSFISNTREMVP